MRARKDRRDDTVVDADQKYRVGRCSRNRKPFCTALRPPCSPSFACERGDPARQVRFRIKTGWG